MKHLVCSLLVSFLLVPLVWSQTRAIQPVRIEAQTAQDETISYIYEESHALIIGVSEYNNGWSKLPGVKTDVMEVSRALEKNGFEVEVVEDPTLDELEIAIEDFIFDKGADPENRLLIYYAGHGHTMKLGYGGEMGFLVPADAPLPAKSNAIQFQRKVLSMQRIEEVAKSTSAKHVLFMFDSCFAGSVFLATRAAPSYIEVFTEEPVRQFITSGSAEQEVPDISIFRRAFVDALEGSADFDKDGYLTGSELGTYIQKRTAEDWKGELTPQYGKLQDPNLNKGDFVFRTHEKDSKNHNKLDPVEQIWAIIENSDNPEAFKEFLSEFPNSPQARLAKFKLLSMGVPHDKPFLSQSPEKGMGTGQSSPKASSNEATDQRARFEKAMIDLKAFHYAPAFRAFQKLAEEGHLESQHRLAMMHRFGLGTETDYKKAVEWFFKAANSGFSESQYQVGIMYKKGWGVSKNLEVANYWLEKAKETK